MASYAVFLNTDWDNYRILCECPQNTSSKERTESRTNSSKEIHISSSCLVPRTSRFLCPFPSLSLLQHTWAKSVILVWGEEFILDPKMVSLQDENYEMNISELLHTPQLPAL